MSDRPHLLLVDDERSIREPLAAYLQKNGFRVTAVGDAAAARQRLAGYAIDLVVLDIMMPGEDGLSLCRHIRESGEIPVILLTARSEETDRIVGLEMGADDYVPKPANPRELLARIRSVLRRSRATPGGSGGGADVPVRNFLRFAGWRLDPVSRELFDPEDVIINLSDGEFRLLLAMVERPRRVLTRDQLLETSRGPMAEQYDRAIDVQLSRLRKKLQRPGREELIRTIRNEGYMFTAKVKRT